MQFRGTTNSNLTLNLKGSGISLFEPFFYGELKFFSHSRIFPVFIHHPTTNLFVFFRNFAGIGRSRCQVMFIGLEPVCVT